MRDRHLADVLQGLKESEGRCRVSLKCAFMDGLTRGVKAGKLNGACDVRLQPTPSRYVV